MSRTTFLIIGLLLVAASPARAATAQVTEQRVIYKAAPGERNVLIAEAADGALTLRDAGARITPGGGCVAIEDASGAAQDRSDPSRCCAPTWATATTARRRGTSAPSSGAAATTR